MVHQPARAVAVACLGAVAALLPIFSSICIPLLECELEVAEQTNPARAEAEQAAEAEAAQHAAEGAGAVEAAVGVDAAGGGGAGALTAVSRFRQIHFGCLLIGDWLYAVLGFPAACLYLKRHS